MKKSLVNLSVILVILPVSFGSSEKLACNKSKHESVKKSEVKHQNIEEKTQENDSEKNNKNTYRMNCMEIVS